MTREEAIKRIGYIVEAVRDLRITPVNAIMDIEEILDQITEEDA